jgi:hypothetical protein
VAGDGSAGWPGMGDTTRRLRGGRRLKVGG